MNIRRIIYLAIIAFLIIYLFSFSDNNSKPQYSIPPKLETADIIASFKGSEEVSSIHGGKRLYFPTEFTGQAGEVFYLVVDKKNYKYKLELVENADKPILTYEFKESYDNYILPEAKFSIYDL